jgi:translation machinery-associated protein 16
MPDLSTEDNIAMLDRWEGEWSFLSNIKWVKVTQAGDVRPSSFPPKA